MSLLQVLQCNMHRGTASTRLPEVVLHHPGHPPHQVSTHNVFVSEYKSYLVSAKAPRHELPPCYVIVLHKFHLFNLQIRLLLQASTKALVKTNHSKQVYVVCTCLSFSCIC